MIIINPETSRKFYTPINKEGFDVDYISVTYRFIIEKNHLKFLTTTDEYNPGCFAQGLFNTFFVEIDENNKIKTYEKDGYICLNILKVQFVGEKIIYTEFLTDEDHKNTPQLYINCESNVQSEKEIKFSTQLIKNFIADNPKYHFEGITKKYSTYRNKLNEYYMLNSKEVFKHQYWYRYNKKYRELTDNGFSDICFAAIDGFIREKKVSAEIDNLYPKFKNKTIKDLNDKQLIFLHRNYNDRENILLLFFDFNFDIPDFKSFKELYGNFNDFSLRCFSNLAKYFPYYTNDGKYDGCKLLQRIKELTDFNTTAHDPGRLLSLLNSLSNIFGKEKLIEVCKGFKDFNDVKELEYNERINFKENKKKSLEKEILTDDYRQNCDFNDYDIYDNKVFIIKKVKSVSELCPSDLDIYTSLLTNFEKNEILAYVLEDNKKIGLVQINIKKRTYKRVISGYPSLNVDSVIDNIIPKYLKIFYSEFLKRDLEDAV